MADTVTTEAETTEKKGKDVFTGGTKNEEGKHTEAPADFDFVKYKPIKKTDFLSDEIYLDHQEIICRAKAESYTLKAEKCAKQAATMRELGDPETRKKAFKLQKMREQLAALELSLTEDGVDLDLLKA